MIWKVFITLSVVLLGIAQICRDDHYNAIRHEFYEVWDNIEEMRGGS